MRALLIFLAASCAGCAAPLADTSKHSGRAATTDAATIGLVDEPVLSVPVNEPAPIAAAEPAAEPSPPAMSKDEIAELVKSVVAEQLSQRDRQLAEANETAAAASAAQQKADAKAIERAVQQVAEKISQQVAQAAEQTARSAQQKAREAAEAARQQDEALARFLLLPDEMNRVERIKAKLEAEGLWELSSQDLDFAAEGLAAPLLREALDKAAERFDANSETDVLAKKAGLTPQEKIQFATMQPLERQQLLTFAEQLDRGEKSVTGDRYVREYVQRYPFIRKVLLLYVHRPETP